MKKTFFIILAACFLKAAPVCAQAQEIEQLLLDIEKLKGLEKILDEMYTGYKILDKGYTTVRDIVNGNYSLHQAFIDGLMAVNPAVRNYKKIPFIISYQKILIKEYTGAYARFKRDKNFSDSELAYLTSVYTFLFNASVRNIDELMTIITATKLSMTDDERMRAVDRIFYDMESKLVFIRSFNSSTQMLAIQRYKDQQDAKAIERLYGVK